MRPDTTRPFAARTLEIGPPRSGTLSRAVSSKAFLTLTLLLAACLRLGHVLALRRLPLFDVLGVDSWMYDTWARRIAGGDWLGARAFYMDPLYPYFLAVLYRLFGRDLMLVRLVQVALGVATCGLVAAMGRRIAGRVAGHVGALLLAVYVPAIFQEGEVEKTALGVFLVTAALTLAMRPSVAARLGAGLTLGLAALTRGNMLLLVPLAAHYFATERDPASAGEPPRQATRGWRERLGQRLRERSSRSAAAFVVGFFVVLAPVAWRNHRVSGEWILTTSGGGQVFYTGNNPDNETGGFVTPKFVRGHPQYEEEDFRAAAEAAVGRPLGPREVSTFWFRQGLRHIAANPGFASKVALRKLALLVSDYEVPDAWDMYFLARYSPVLGWPLLGMGCLLPLAVLGAVVGCSRREVRLLAGFVCVYGLSVVIFFVFSRYRLHAAPAMAVLAGSAVPWIASVVQQRDRRRALLAVGLVSATALVSFRATDAGAYDVANEVQSRINLASAYEAKGDVAAAERLLEDARRVAPAMPGPVCQLGRLRVDAGRVREAEADFLRCIEMDFGYPEAWLSLGQLYQRTGRLEAAISAYRAQLELLPGAVDAEVGLAEAEIGIGAAARTAERLAPLAKRADADPRLLRLLATALRATARDAESRAVVERAQAAGHPISKEDVERELARLKGAAPSGRPSHGADRLPRAP